MKKELYVHIGLPKTGTTALQTFFNTNTEALLNAGYYYPKAFRDSENMAHHILPYLIASGSEDIVNILSREISESENNYKFTKIILSSEGFINLLLDSSTSSLFDLFLSQMEIDFQVKIILSIRKINEYIKSIYVQNIIYESFYEEPIKYTISLIHALALILKKIYLRDNTITFYHSHNINTEIINYLEIKHNNIIKITHKTPDNKVVIVIMAANMRGITIQNDLRSFILFYEKSREIMDKFFIKNNEDLKFENSNFRRIDDELSEAIKNIKSINIGEQTNDILNKIFFINIHNNCVDTIKYSEAIDELNFIYESSIIISKSIHFSNIWNELVTSAQIEMGIDFSDSLCQE